MSLDPQADALGGWEAGGAFDPQADALGDWEAGGEPQASPVWPLDDDYQVPVPAAPSGEELTLLPGTERIFLSTEQRKKNHINSEKKRREAIRLGFDRMCEILPDMKGNGRSEILVLQRFSEHAREQLELRRQIIADREAQGLPVDDDLRVSVAHFDSLPEAAKIVPSYGKVPKARAKAATTKGKGKAKRKPKPKPKGRPKGTGKGKAKAQEGPKELDADEVEGDSMDDDVTNDDQSDHADDDAGDDEGDRADASDSKTRRPPTFTPYAD